MKKPKSKVTKKRSTLESTNRLRAETVGEEVCRKGRVGCFQTSTHFMTKVLQYLKCMWSWLLSVAKWIGRKAVWLPAIAALFAIPYYILGYVTHCSDRDAGQWLVVVEKDPRIHSEIDSRRPQPLTDQQQRLLERLNRALERDSSRLKDLPVTALLKMGVAEFAKGELFKASKYFEMARDASLTAGDDLSKAQSLYNLGVTYAHTGEQEKALELLRESLALVRGMGRKDSEARILMEVGDIYALRGDMPAAKRFYDDVCTIGKESSSPSTEADCFFSKGTVSLNQGEFKSAADFFEHALRIDREVSDYAGQYSDLLNLAAVFKNSGDMKRSLAFIYSFALS